LRKSVAKRENSLLLTNSLPQNSSAKS